MPLIYSMVGQDAVTQDIDENHRRICLHTSRPAFWLSISHEIEIATVKPTCTHTDRVIFQVKDCCFSDCSRIDRAKFSNQGIQREGVAHPDLDAEEQERNIHQRGIKLFAKISFKTT